MGVVALVFRSEMRRRWRSWLALVLLTALVGGVALAATAAGRRTASAFPSFVARYGFDVGVYTDGPTPQLSRLPLVSSATEVLGPDSGQPTCRCTRPINPTDFGVIVPPRARSIFKLVSGHFPDPNATDQVLASFTLQQGYGIHIGSIVRVPFYAASQASAYSNTVSAPPAPRGPTVALQVVGFEAAEFEFPSGGAPSYDLYTTPAFARVVLPRTAYGYLYLVNLRHGAADLPRFTAEANALGAYPENLGSEVASVQASIHPQAMGWWVLAVLAALVGLAVIGQALFRQSGVESEDYPTLSAVGVDRRQIVALGMARTLVVAVAGAVGALIVATVLSPIAPLGEARTAEPSTGLSFDALVLPLGALAIVAIVLALGIWPSLKASRTLRTEERSLASHPSPVAGLIAKMGAPPSMLIGARHALERRSGGGAVPVGSALLGTALAVVALCGTGVFGASLSHLTTTPRLYGDPFQINFSDSSGGKGGPDPALLASLEHDPTVTGLTEGFATDISIDKATVGAIVATSLKGRLLFSTVNGQLPNGDGQVGLGVKTMREAGVQLGSVVRVTLPRPSGAKVTSPFRVVSQVSFPVLGGGGLTSLGNGAVFTVGGFEHMACPPGTGQVACQHGLFVNATAGGLLASFVPGPRGEAAVNHYLDAYRSIAAPSITPTSLVNFGEAVNFPLIFAAMLAVFGAATLVHLLVVSVSRRRHEIGLLKALGFVNAQVSAAVAWQATTLAVVGTVVGAPLGVVTGRAVWSAFANNLGVVPVSVVELWLIVVLVAGVLAVANLLAVAPALVARRSKPQELLRAQ